MRITQTQILDCRSSTEQPVTANVIENPPDNIVISASRIWTKYKKRSGFAAEHFHWNWEDKLMREHNEGTAFRIYAIEYEQSLQGLILLNVGWQNVCQLPEQKGERLVYVHYVEVAPWNNEHYQKSPQFKRNGTRLIQAAVQFSIEMGYNGRIGLSSLPSAEMFYEKGLSLTRIPNVDGNEGLTVFELLKSDVPLLLEKKS